MASIPPNVPNKPTQVNYSMKAPAEKKEKQGSMMIDPVPATPQTSSKGSIAASKPLPHSSKIAPFALNQLGFAPEPPVSNKLTFLNAQCQRSNELQRPGESIEEKLDRLPISFIVMDKKGKTSLDCSLLGALCTSRTAEKRAVFENLREGLKRGDLSGADIIVSLPDGSMIIANPTVVNKHLYSIVGTEGDKRLVNDYTEQLLKFQTTPKLSNEERSREITRNLMKGNSRAIPGFDKLSKKRQERLMEDAKEQSPFPGMSLIKGVSGISEDPISLLNSDSVDFGGAFQGTLGDNKTTFTVFYTYDTTGHAASEGTREVLEASFKKFEEAIKNELSAKTAAELTKEAVNSIFTKHSGSIENNLNMGGGAGMYALNFGDATVLMTHGDGAFIIRQPGTEPLFVFDREEKQAVNIVEVVSTPPGTQVAALTDGTVDGWRAHLTSELLGIVEQQPEYQVSKARYKEIIREKITTTMESRIDRIVTKVNNKFPNPTPEGREGCVREINDIIQGGDRLGETLFQIAEQYHGDSGNINKSNDEKIIELKALFLKKIIDQGLLDVSESRISKTADKDMKEIMYKKIFDDKATISLLNVKRKLETELSTLNAQRMEIKEKRGQFDKAIEEASSNLAQAKNELENTSKIKIMSRKNITQNIAEINQKIENLKGSRKKECSIEEVQKVERQIKAIEERINTTSEQINQSFKAKIKSILEGKTQLDPIDISEEGIEALEKSFKPFKSIAYAISVEMGFELLYGNMDITAPNLILGALELSHDDLSAAVYTVPGVVQQPQLQVPTSSSS